MNKVLISLIIITAFYMGIVIYMLVTNTKNYTTLRERETWNTKEIEDIKRSNELEIAASTETPKTYVATNNNTYTTPEALGYFYNETTGKIDFGTLKNKYKKIYNNYDPVYLYTPEALQRDKREKENVDLTYMIIMITLLTGIFMCCILNLDYTFQGQNRINSQTQAGQNRIKSQTQVSARQLKDVKTDMAKLVSELESLKN